MNAFIQIFSSGIDVCRYARRTSLVAGIALLSTGAALADSSGTAVPASPLFEVAISDDPLFFLADVSVRGENIPFIINTSATRPMVVDTVAAGIYGSPIRPVKVGQTNDGAIYNFPEVQLGKIKIPAGEVTAMDISSARVTTGLPIAGVFGWASLEGRILVIDHDKKVLQICKEKSDLPRFEVALPITEESQIPHVKSKMGTREISLVVNTGDEGGISLVPDEFSRLVDEGWIAMSSDKVPQGTVGGVERVKSGWFVKGELFGVDLKGMSAMYSSTGENSVGLTFLLKLNFSMSNSPSLFSYSLRKDPTIPISANRMTGAIFLYRGGHGVVAKLKPGGQAEKAGLLLNDEVVSIDEIQGKPLNKINLYLVCRQQAGKSLTLNLLRQGSSKTITLNLGVATSAWNVEN